MTAPAWWLAQRSQHQPPLTPPTHYHFAFLQGGSQYSVLNHMSEDIITALEAQGHTCSWVSLEGCSSLSEALLKHLTASPNVDAVLALNGSIPGSESFETPSVWDKFELPIVSVYVDHPLKINTRLRKKTPYQINLYACQDWLDMAVNHYEAVAGYNALYTIGNSYVCPEPALPFPQKENRLLLAGTYHPSYKSWEALKKLPPRLLALVCEAMDAQFADPTADYGTRLLALLEAAGYPFQTSGDASLRSLFVFSERFMIAKYREEYLRLLVDTPLTLIGDTWKTSATTSPLWRYEASMPYHAFHEAIHRHAFVLNPSPLFPNLLHDRVANVLHQGSVLVSEATPTLDAFLGSDAYIGLPYQNPAQGVEALKAAMTDASLAEAMAQRGQAALQDSFTMAHTASQIVSAFEGWGSGLWLSSQG